MKYESVWSSIKIVVVLLISVSICSCITDEERGISRAADILSLLGPEDQSSKVDRNVAKELISCFKFLVPYAVTAPVEDAMVINNVASEMNDYEIENNLISWPPPSVLRLARDTFQANGGARGRLDVIDNALDTPAITVPNVEGSEESKCQLNSTPKCYHFIDDGLTAYINILFDMIVSRGPRWGLNVSLNRFDLFHGHLFIAKDTGRLGILFHAQEYPDTDDILFPYYQGYCQIGTDLVYDTASMNLRNILWLAPMRSNSSGDAWVAPGVLVALDARPEHDREGNQGIIYRDLIYDYPPSKSARNIFEGNFGHKAVDVNYLNVGQATSPTYEVLIC